MNPRGYLSGSLPYSHEAHGIVHSGEYWHQTAYGFQAAPRQTVPSMEHAYPSSYSVEHAALPGNANSNYIATPTGFSQFVGSCLSENVPPGPTVRLHKGNTPSLNVRGSVFLQVRCCESNGVLLFSYLVCLFVDCSSDLKTDCVRSKTCILENGPGL